jgi:hypothetical protein
MATNESIDYLRALKQSLDPAPASAAPPVREAAVQKPETTGTGTTYGEGFRGQERRSSARYKCEGSAQLREDGRDIRTWATFKDVSLHGCYVETQATYPVGTTVHLKLEANGFRVESKGIVRVNYPSLGMGIAFREMSADNMVQLRELLATISRPTVVMGTGIASLPRRALGPVPLADPAAAVEALTEFFENRQMLMRDDFLRILCNSQTKP